jgi:hypothetical protein
MTFKEATAVCFETQQNKLFKVRVVQRGTRDYHCSVKRYTA